MNNIVRPRLRGERSRFGGDGLTAINAERRVRQAKKFYSEVGFKQGYEAGEEQGLEQGLEQGKKEEAARISALINCLLADGREQDILLLGDQETLKRLLEEYSL